MPPLQHLLKGAGAESEVDAKMTRQVQTKDVRRGLIASQMPATQGRGAGLHIHDVARQGKNRKLSCFLLKNCRFI